MVPQKERVEGDERLCTNDKGRVQRGFCQFRGIIEGRKAVFEALVDDAELTRQSNVGCCRQVPAVGTALTFLV
jgi:hypothetical protein